MHLVQTQSYADDYNSTTSRRISETDEVAHTVIFVRNFVSSILCMLRYLAAPFLHSIYNHPT